MRDHHLFRRALPALGSLQSYIGLLLVIAVGI